MTTNNLNKQHFDNIVKLLDDIFAHTKTCISNTPKVKTLVTIKQSEILNEWPELWYKDNNCDENMYTPNWNNAVDYLISILSDILKYDVTTDIKNILHDTHQGRALFYALYVVYSDYKRRDILLFINDVKLQKLKSHFIVGIYLDKKQLWVNKYCLGIWALENIIMPKEWKLAEGRIKLITVEFGLQPMIRKVIPAESSYGVPYDSTKWLGNHLVELYIYIKGPILYLCRFRLIKDPPVLGRMLYCKRS